MGMWHCNDLQCQLTWHQWATRSTSVYEAKDAISIDIVIDISYYVHIVVTV